MILLRTKCTINQDFTAEELRTQLIDTMNSIVRIQDFSFLHVCSQGLEWASTTSCEHPSEFDVNCDIKWLDANLPADQLLSVKEIAYKGEAFAEIFQTFPNSYIIKVLREKGHTKSYTYTMLHLDTKPSFSNKFNMENANLMNTMTDLYIRYTDLVLQHSFSLKLTYFEEFLDE